MSQETHREAENNDETPEDDSEAHETATKSDEESSSSEDETESYGGRGFVGRSASPMTASPFDTSGSEGSTIEEKIGADYWLCPYCPNFSAESVGSVRDHITSKGNDLHAGQSGWSHDRHIPGFDSDDELVGAVLGITDAGDPTGLMAINEFPDSVNFEMHDHRNEMIPMALQETKDDTETNDEETTDEVVENEQETSEDSVQSDQSTEKTMNATIESTDESIEESVIAWICPYCIEPNDNEHAIRLHINHSSTGGHEGKDGWNLVDQVPGINTSGEVIAILNTEADAEEGNVIPVSELDDQPEVDQADLATLADEVDGLDIEESTIEDENEDSRPSVEPLTGEKKIEIVNAWVSAGDLEEELGLDEDEEFGATEVSDVTGASYPYCYKVGRELENDRFDPDVLESALDETKQSTYREGFEQQLKERSEEASDETSEKDETEDTVSEEETVDTQQEGSTTDSPDETVKPDSPTETESKTVGKTDELMSISQGEEGESMARTEETTSVTGENEDGEEVEVAGQNETVIGTESTEPSTESPTEQPISRIEGDDVNIPLEDIQALQETLERYQSGARVDAETFAHDQVVRARADEREHVARQINEMVASLIPKPEASQ